LSAVDVVVLSDTHVRSGGATRLSDAAAGLVAHYLAVPQGAARATKELVRSAFDADFATAHARSRALVADCLAGPDVAAARAAWAVRR